MIEIGVEANKLRLVIETVNTLVDETRVNIGEDKLDIKAIDPSNVGMVHLSMKKDTFTKYELDEDDDSEEDKVIGVNLKRISDFLQLCDSDDIVNLDIDKDVLYLKADNLTQNIPLLDLDNLNPVEPPTLDLPNNVKLSAKFLRKGVRAADNITDHIVMTFEKDKFNIHGEDGNNKIDLELNPSNFENYDIEEEGTTKYGLDYFNAMIKCIKDSYIINLELKEDNPLMMDYDIDDDISVRFMLAPRISAE